MRDYHTKVSLWAVIQKLIVFADSTYMPSLVIISGGENLSLLKEISTINLSPNDRIVSLLTNMKEFYRFEFYLIGRLGKDIK